MRSCNGVLNKRHSEEDGHCTSLITPNYKLRKVSSVCDFPGGYRPNSPGIEENLVDDKQMLNVFVVKDSENCNKPLSLEAEKLQLVDVSVVGYGNIVKDPDTEKLYPRRRVLATRASREMAMEKIHKLMKLGKNVPDVKTETEFTEEQDGLLRVKMATKIDGGSLVSETRRSGVKESDGYVRENDSLQGGPEVCVPGEKTEYVKVDQKDHWDDSGVIENMCKEMVVYVEKNLDSRDTGTVAHGPEDVDKVSGKKKSNSCGEGNMRNKVRETLRLFHTHCRKLLQGEEAKRKTGKRIDLEAASMIRKSGKEVNTSTLLIGEVPGVEVGDEFQYRVELALVGVHRLYQAGIDYMMNNGEFICTSIVSSGGYADILNNPDVLTYSGQGGMPDHKKGKEAEDQKLEKGNLALKNSITAKNPVRVIHGTKDNSKGKLVSSYSYDGLYTVEKYWQEVGNYGKLVYKFELRRIPGQPEVSWKEVKKSKKLKCREGICVEDISNGKELFRICAVNTVDNEKPPAFTYITKMIYPTWYSPTPLQGCGCVGGCKDSRKCSCVLSNGEEIPYNRNGAIVEAKTLVYECSPSCKCPPSCHNRVTQHGIKIQLEIFKTETRGWGVRSLNSISSGSFICEYIGELLEEKAAEERVYDDEYLFDIGRNYTGSSSQTTSLLSEEETEEEEEEDSGFTIDAAVYGNVGRFINHSCSPNLYAQNVMFDHDDKSMPHVMLFAAENIPPLQELTYHYNYSMDQVRDRNGNVRTKPCYCGSEECEGRMY